VACITFRRRTLKLPVYMAASAVYSGMFTSKGEGSVGVIEGDLAPSGSGMAYPQSVRIGRYGYHHWHGMHNISSAYLYIARLHGSQCSLLRYVYQ